MKRFFIVVLVSILSNLNAQAQEIGLNIGYQFIEANQWNRATKVYNFSRPFLKNKQALLKHGISFGVYYLRKSGTAFHWGPSVSFFFHPSYSENPNFDIGINSFLFNLGIKLQFQPMIKENNNLRLSFTPSLEGVMLSRKLNGEIVITGETEEDIKLRTGGIGLGLNTQVAYDFSINDSWAISPVVGINYDPIVWTYRSELIFNEATVGDLKSSTSIWRFQGGIVVKKKIKN